MTKGGARFLLAASLLALTQSARSNELVTYSYDTLGRLTKVSRSGTVNNGVTADYSYDASDNRTNVTVAASGSAPPPPANSPPTPVNDSGVQGRCTTQYYNVVANDTDPDGNYPLTLVSVTGMGFVVASATTIEFTSLSYGRTGTYTVRDSLGATATATLTVTLAGGTCTPGGPLQAPTQEPETVQ